MRDEQIACLSRGFSFQRDVDAIKLADEAAHRLADQHVIVDK